MEPLLSLMKRLGSFLNLLFLLAIGAPPVAADPGNAQPKTYKLLPIRWTCLDNSSIAFWGAKQKIGVEFVRDPTFAVIVRQFPSGKKLRELRPPEQARWKLIAFHQETLLVLQSTSAEVVDEMLFINPRSGVVMHRFPLKASYPEPTPAFGSAQEPCSIFHLNGLLYSFSFRENAFYVIDAAQGRVARHEILITQESSETSRVIWSGAWQGMLAWVWENAPRETELIQTDPENCHRRATISKGCCKIGLADPVTWQLRWTGSLKLPHLEEEEPTRFMAVKDYLIGVIGPNNQELVAWKFGPNVDGKTAGLRECWRYRIPESERHMKDSYLRERILWAADDKAVYCLYDWQPWNHSNTVRHTIAAIDATDGKTIWRRDFDAEEIIDIQIDEGRLVILGYIFPEGGAAWRLSPASGKVMETLLTGQSVYLNSSQGVLFGRESRNSIAIYLLDRRRPCIPQPLKTLMADLLVHKQGNVSRLGQRVKPYLTALFEEKMEKEFFLSSIRLPGTGRERRYPLPVEIV